MLDSSEHSAAPIFQPLNGITTTTAVESDVMVEHVKHAVTLNLPKVFKLPEFRVFKGDNATAALLGGGPSLKETIKEVKNFDSVFVCGSSNDYVLDNGILPTYVVVCDPDPVVLKYLTKLDKRIKYLIATCCHPSVFEYLKDYQVYAWHCHSDAQAQYLRALEEPYEAICGGCTVGLRTQSIAILFGYRNLHFFGFDSCISDEEHHAYEFATQEEKEQVGVIHEIKLGVVFDKESNKYGPGEKIYKCIGYQMAQAEHFRAFYQEYSQYYNPIFHGEGLLPDLMKLIKFRSNELEKGLAA